jgi:hypothetical protein
MNCIATTTHTMIVELSHEVVVWFMRWLFREATTSFSLLHIIKNHMWHCMGRPMRLLTCTNVLTLIDNTPRGYRGKQSSILITTIIHESC